MKEWDFIERRRFPRYNVNLPVLQKSEQDCASITHDICEQGIGITSQKKIPLGMPFEVEIIIPDNYEKIEVFGRLVWISQIDEKTYRAGIQLEKSHLQPISIALRMIRYRLVNGNKMTYET
ncbi:MAG: PilZ domain-containing protein [Candidatus Omnitrophica bacterium]|nr:PilZ domain-containing protein [Candidatus Omnitrophota bacterium]